MVIQHSGVRRKKMRRKKLLAKKVQVKYAVMIIGIMVILLAISQFYTYRTLQSLLPAILSTEIGNGIIVLQPNLLIIGLVYIVIISVLPIYVTHRMVGPVYQLEKEELQIIDQPDMRFRFKFRKKDEFQYVAESLNKMMENLENKYGGI